MTGSVFSSVHAYFSSVFRGIKSIWVSCVTALPYFFSAGELRKEVTEQYPDPISSKTADDLPPRTRGLLFNDIDRCTGCRECAKACPTGCIRVEAEPGADSNKLWVSVFDIDFSKCIFCGICVEVCQPASLVHTKQYEGSVYAPTDLVASFGRGNITPQQKEKWASLRRRNESDASGGLS